MLCLFMCIHVHVCHVYEEGTYGQIYMPRIDVGCMLRSHASIVNNIELLFERKCDSRLTT
jgi:hypothetical protein